MAGLDRAVAWVKANKPHLRKGFSFYLDRKTGIRISVGFLDKDDKDLEVILALFRGKRATRTVTEDGHERFQLFDAGLTFEWEIWHFEERRKREVMEVTL